MRSGPHLTWHRSTPSSSTSPRQASTASSLSSSHTRSRHAQKQTDLTSRPKQSQVFTHAGAERRMSVSASAENGPPRPHRRGVSPPAGFRDVCKFRLGCRARRRQRRLAGKARQGCAGALRLEGRAVPPGEIVRGPPVADREQPGAPPGAGSHWGRQPNLLCAGHVIPSEASLGLMIGDAR